MRFPEALIEEWASVLFVALAARLVNDSSADCRSMYIGAAQALLQVGLQSSACCDVGLCRAFGSELLGSVALFSGFAEL